MLYEVYFFAQSEYLPLTCKRLHTVFKHAPPSVHAEYLLCRLQRLLEKSLAPKPQFLTAIFRYPLVTEPVLSSLLTHPIVTSHPYLLLQPPHLPRRLFRSLPQRQPGSIPLKERHAPLPFLRFLYNHPKIPRPNTNAHEGYALARAVLAGFVPLIEFLLDHGADPGLKGGIAVKVAIQMRDLGLVRMLVEPGYTPPTTSITASLASRRSSFGRRIGAVGPGKGDENASVASGAKRRRMEDRMKVTPKLLQTAVRHGAMDIVDWMMNEKGCVPDMKTISLMTMMRSGQ